MQRRERKINGAKVKRLRDAAWLSQGELAQRAGVAPHTISRMETGAHPYPRRSTIFAVAEALDVKPEELLEPSGNSFPLPNGPATDEGEPGEARRTS